MPPKGSGSGGGDSSDVDSMIRVRLARLPKSGDVWQEAQRDLWLGLPKGSFKLIYKDEAGDRDVLLGV
jgi:hypothetical protein